MILQSEGGGDVACINVNMQVCKEQYWSTLHSSAILAFFHIERMYLQTRSSVSLQSHNNCSHGPVYVRL